jgi:hypothetical protein
MTTETWIMVGIAAVQTAATICGVFISWRMTKRQIQIMLAQTHPAEKAPKRKTFWLRIIMFIWCMVAIPACILLILYYLLWFSAISRSDAALLAWIAFNLPLNIFGSWYWYHQPWREGGH